MLNGLIIDERSPLSTAQSFELAAPASLVGAALFFSCVGGSVATVVSEREQQTLKRLFLSPLSGISYFLGIFVAHSCIGLGQTLLIYTAATFWGAKFHGSPLLGMIIILLSITAYVGVGFILGTQFARRTEDVNALVATFGVPLLMLGGAFVPVRLFPDFLLRLAKFNPIYHMNEALTGVSANNMGIGEIGDHLSILALVAIAMIGSGWWFYQRMVQRERRL